MLAAQEGHAVVVAMLLRAGAAIDLTDSEVSDSVARMICTVLC